jgi:hypothetical protein
MKNFNNFIKENTQEDTSQKTDSTGSKEGIEKTITKEDPPKKPDGTVEKIDNEELMKKFPIGHQFNYKTNKGKESVEVVGYIDLGNNNYNVVVYSKKNKLYYPIKKNFKQFAKASDDSKLDINSMIEVFKNLADDHQRRKKKIGQAKEAQTQKSQS